MYADNGKHTRIDVVKMLMSSFNAIGVAKFGPGSEEKAYLENGNGALSVADCKRQIKEEISLAGEELSVLSDIHPAWIVKALEAETPKIIGIILRWLPSRHVRYILENLPKRIKICLPRLVESFAVPTDILRLIKRGFESKFKIPVRPSSIDTSIFENIVYLNPAELEGLFRDLGVHELAMAFQTVEPDGLKILLNRMAVETARALQQRIKNVADVNALLQRDAGYTILEVAMDQEDVNRLLLELGLAAFSKAMKNQDMFSILQQKMEPQVTYIFKRYIDQYANTGKLSSERQRIIMERLSLLMKAGQVG
jgi:hypothetical protein